MKNPRFVFGFAERINVENRLPLGIARPVPFPARSAEQTAAMVGVGPEVVHRLAVTGWVGNPVVGFEYVECRHSDLLKPWVNEQRRLSALIALAHPRQGIVALNILEPQILVDMFHLIDGTRQHAWPQPRAWLSSALGEERFVAVAEDHVELVGDQRVIRQLGVGINDCERCLSSLLDQLSIASQRRQL
jgi:hypothetical protein